MRWCMLVLVMVLGLPHPGWAKTTATFEDLGRCNPLEAGATLTSATLAAAIASTSNPDCSGNRVLLLTPGSWVISSNLLIPDRLAVEVPQGALFSINAGASVTLDCRKLVSSVYPVFTGPGSVTCSNVPYTVPYAASLTFAADISPVQAVVLTGNVTSITLSQGAALLSRGSVLWLRFTQDATGGRTVTGWPGSVIWASGSAPTITTTAGATTIIALLYDGVSWRDFLVNLAPPGGAAAGTTTPEVPWVPTGTVTATQTMIPAAGGATYPTVTLTDSGTDCLYTTLVTPPPGWIGSTGLVVRAEGIHTGTPTGEALGLSVAAQCRADNSAMNDTWSSVVALSVPFTTVNRLEVVQSSLVTPEGPCTGGTEASPLRVNVRVCVNTLTFVCSDPTKCHLVDLIVRFIVP